MPSRFVVFFPPTDFIGVVPFVSSLQEALRRCDWGEGRLVVWPQSFQKLLEERGCPLAQGTLVLIGVSPTPSGIKQAASLKSELTLAGFPADGTVLIGMGQGLPGEIPSDVLEESAGTIKVWVPFEPQLLLKAQLEGKTIFDLAPKSRIAVQILVCAQFIKQSAKEIDEVRALGPSTSSNVQDFSEWGPVGKWLQDDGVNEIMINGTQKMFIEKNGAVVQEASPFQREEDIQRLIDRITAPAGRRADFASPLCDVRLKDGSRINVALPPVSLVGPVLTIRKFRPHLRAMEDLLRCGSLTIEQGQILQRSIEDRLNIVLAGNAGAGKTTLLNVLAAFIPSHERIITIEDTAELQLSNPHVVSLESRQKNTEGQGEISLNDLVVNALRMRPDRLIIGECRGREVLSLLQAMNTGHDGALTTLHANSAADAVQRLEGMVLLGAPRWPIEVVRQQLASALDVIVYMKREGGRRRVHEIVRLSLGNGRIQTEPL